MNRALLWLFAGLAVLVLAVLAIAPELLSDLGTAASTVAIALVALVPAVLVAVLFVSTRRRAGRNRRADRSTTDHRPVPDDHDHDHDHAHEHEHEHGG